CRRYWTQGGTLRNVPVGGGCRKGKRSTQNKKPTPSSSATSTQDHHQQQNVSQSSTYKNLLMPSSAANPSPIYYYPGVGGGSIGASGMFLSSLAPYQSFNQQIPISANNDHNNIGVSNSALLQGFSLPSLQHQQKQQQLQPHSQYLNMGGINTKEEKPILPLEAGNLIRPPSTQHHHQEWFLPNFNNSNPIGTPDGVNYWNSQTTTTTTTTTNTNNDNTATVSTTDGTTTTPMNPPPSTAIQHHWSDLGGSFGTATNTDQPSSPPSSLL
ncbi:hypothetical protein MKW92_003895, partial [Papaver armeniacum]